MRIEHFFFIQSPYAYLGFQRLLDIAARHGAEVIHRPMSGGRIFPATGGLPLAQRPPERLKYRLVELDRWRTYLGVPLNLEPAHFPHPDMPGAGVVLAAREAGLDAGRLAMAIQRATWAEERNMGDEAQVAALLIENNFPADLLEAGKSEAIQKTFEAESDAALAYGIFGAPSYVLDGELFWGQDRLDFLDRALAARA
ncbi:MAG: 2-hydroxychromene-2-carboxylate isomerase [Rhodospirillales bacterium]